MMSTATIVKTKQAKQKRDFLAMPRKEYKALLRLSKVQEFTPTSAQKRALRKAESNFRQGKTLSYGEVLEKLGFAN